jgi:hypothetical protein
VPIPPLQVVVVLSTVVLVDEVVVVVLVDDVVVGSVVVVVVLGPLVVVGAGLVVEVVERPVVLGEGDGVGVVVAGGTSGAAVGGGAKVAGGGLVGPTAGSVGRVVVVGRMVRFGDGPVPEGTLIDDEDDEGVAGGLVTTLDVVGETGGGALVPGVDRRAGA